MSYCVCCRRANRDFTRQASSASNLFAERCNCQFLFIGKHQRRIPNNTVILWGRGRRGDDRHSQANTSPKSERCFWSLSALMWLGSNSERWVLSRISKNALFVFPHIYSWMTICKAYWISYISIDSFRNRSISGDFICRLDQSTWIETNEKEVWPFVDNHSGKQREECRADSNQWSECCPCAFQNSIQWLPCTATTFWQYCTETHLWSNCMQENFR
jgi:hypothetical protein